MKLIKPMLCKLQDKPFDDPRYFWEPKLDGARIVAYVNSQEVRLFGRSGKEKTGLFPDLKIETRVPAVLDGEIISGACFNDLQHRINRGSGITQAAKDFPATYSVFDILEVDGVNVQCYPLEKRKEMLRLVLMTNDRVVKTPFTETEGIKLFESVKAAHGEGVVGKLKTAPYEQNKRSTWLKVKTWQVDNFMAVGYTKGTGWRESTFGSLVLTDMKGVYVGQVGTGFTDDTIKILMGMFHLGDAPVWAKLVGEPVNWVMPFTVTVQYLEKTNDGILRFPSCKGVI